MQEVGVLLSTYNGEKYLSQQIDSLKGQTGVHISILVRDDGSSDKTKKMLNKWQNEGVLAWYDGENLKPAKSFLNLIRNAPEADYYAFCDQDDVWDKDKLYVAVNRLINSDKNKPSLYFSKAQLVDEKLNRIENITYPKDKFTFGTALIRNNATGCTMVFNRKLLEQVNRYTPQYVLMHDHWIYLLCLALRGHVIYDPDSHIKYRQHGNNVCGVDNSITNRFKNSGFTDKKRIRYKIAVQLYDNYLDLMPKENICLLEKFIKYHNSPRDMFNLIIDRQIKSHSFLTDMALVINIITGKL